MLQMSYLLICYHEIGLILCAFRIYVNSIDICPFVCSYFHTKLLFRSMRVAMPSTSLLQRNKVPQI